MTAVPALGSKEGFGECEPEHDRLGGRLGFHFYSPVVLAAMAASVAVFAANLWGWFEIALPRAIADRAERNSGSGAFAAGAFAAVRALGSVS